MAELFASGLAADIVLVLMAVEAGGLLAYRRLTGRGLAPGSVLACLLPGAFLVLALRVALTGGAGAWVGLCLALAFAAHLGDLARRLRL
jgi:hypothetical protein